MRNKNEFDVIIIGAGVIEDCRENPVKFKQ
jgi:hypothetical protein